MTTPELIDALRKRAARGHCHGCDDKRSRQFRTHHEGTIEHPDPLLVEAAETLEELWLHVGIVVDDKP